MRNVIIAVLCVATSWGTAPAQFDELREAIAKAEEQQEQGRFGEAFKTLTAIKPEAGPLHLLELPYRRGGEHPNEFYLKDRALQKLAEALLLRQESEKAIITARFIAHRPLRDSVLIDILNHRCNEAIAKAEEQLKQGRFGEAFKTLTAIKPLIGPPQSQRHYRSEGEPFNEFYLKDRALQKLVVALLDRQESGKAVITARHIANQPLRNNVLWAILNRQCNAAERKPEEFDQMIAKAKKTADLITGLQGNRRIAQSYAFAGQYDLAIKAIKKIENAENLDSTFLSMVHSISNKAETTLEEARFFREIIALIQSSFMKADALCRFAVFYDSLQKQGKISEADGKEKRLEILRQAMELLLSVPDDSQKNRLLVEIYRFHCTDDRKTEAETVRKAILEPFLNMDHAEEQFRRYTFLSYPANPYQPGQPTDLDLKLYEQMKLYAEKDVWSPERWLALSRIVRQWAPPGSEARAEAFDKTRQAVLKLTDPFQKAQNLLFLVELANSEQIDELFDEVTEIFLTSGSEPNHLHWMCWSVFPRLVQYGNVDRMLELAHLPRIPEAWRQDIYYQAAYELLRDSQSSEFRANDFKELFDLIDNPKSQRRLLGEAERTIKMQFSWPQPIEEVLAISDPDLRYAFCRLLIITNREQNSGVDVMPLLDAIENYVVTNENTGVTVHGYPETLRLAIRYSLWDEKKIDDWLKQYEAAIPQFMQSEGNYTSYFLRQQMFHVVRESLPDDAAKNIWFDKLLAAWREIPVEKYGYRSRLSSFLQMARQAVEVDLPDRAREIVEEALVYAETIPDNIRRFGDVGEQFRQLRLLRDEFSKNDSPK